MLLNMITDLRRNSNSHPQFNVETPEISFQIEDFDSPSILRRNSSSSDTKLSLDVCLAFKAANLCYLQKLSRSSQSLEPKTIPSSSNDRGRKSVPNLQSIRKSCSTTLINENLDEENCLKIKIKKSPSNSLLSTSHIAHVRLS